MDNWMNAWSYFLEFTAETIDSTKKVCHALYLKEGKQLPERIESPQLIRCSADVDMIEKYSYVILCNEKKEPEMICLVLDLEESDAKPDYVLAQESSHCMNYAIKLLSEVAHHVAKDEMKRLIEKGRDFMKADMVQEYASDQMMKKPQPPLVKAPQHEFIPLTKDFNHLPIENDFLKIINQRKSHRIYTDEALTLDELAYLLWCTQGVKNAIKNNYATIRTVPCGGARHEFETYLSIHRVAGLKQGVYHYLPMEHALEFLHEEENIEDVCTQLLCGQDFSGKSACTFMWSCVCYRAEWRYSIHSHRIILQDIGHVGENLYLACESIGLGTCGVGAYLQNEIDAYCQLDGAEEFIVYTAPVGKAMIGERE